MCNNPITHNGNTFACRNCNECIGVRRWNWVARAMAEKAMHRTALAVTLTYDNSTQENRDSAAMFNWRDVELWLKKVRQDLVRKAQKTAKRKRSEFLKKGFQGPPPPRVAAPGLRYLVAGEQGERKRRCHWHAILFSDGDLLEVGKFTDLDGNPLEGDALISRGQRVKPLLWSTWGRGRVVVQEPDSSGMNYALSYVVKDQFSGEKSEGTGRYTRSENFATGLFRMSKAPPLGLPWLLHKMQRLELAGAVLPSVQLKVPGLPGYWVPGGSFRKLVLGECRRINDLVRRDTGQDAPQWGSLLSSCSEIPSDMEILVEQEIEEEARSLETELAFRQRERQRDVLRREVVRRCGGKYPCRACRNSFDEGTLGRIGISRGQDESGAFFYVETRPAPEVVGCNPHCQLRGTRSVAEAFPATGRDAGR